MLVCLQCVTLLKLCPLVALVAFCRPIDLTEEPSKHKTAKQNSSLRKIFRILNLTKGLRQTKSDKRRQKATEGDIGDKQATSYEYSPVAGIEA